MKSLTHYLWFTTKQRQEIIDITDQVAEQVRASGVAEGFTLVSAMHITASVFVNDHESGLWADILKWLETTIGPWDPKRYRHNETGEDNAAAHLRSLTSCPIVRLRRWAAGVLRGVGRAAQEAGDHQGAGGVAQSIDLSSSSLASSLQQSNVPAGTVTRSLPVTRRSSAVECP